jgi:hypothetical protein
MGIEDLSKDSSRRLKKSTPFFFMIKYSGPYNALALLAQIRGASSNIHYKKKKYIYKEVKLRDKFLRKYYTVIPILK